MLRERTREMGRKPWLREHWVRLQTHTGELDPDDWRSQNTSSSSPRLLPFPPWPWRSARVRSARPNEPHSPELLSVCFWLDKPRDAFSLKRWWADTEPQPRWFWHSEAGTGDLWVHSLICSHLSLMLGTFLWALPQLLQRLDPVIFYPVVRAATFAVGYLFLHDWRRQEQAQIPAGPSLQIAAFLGSLKWCFFAALLSVYISMVEFWNCFWISE